MRTDYAALLRQRNEQAREDAADASPISLTEYRARRDMQRWREAWARLNPEPPEAA